MVVSFSNIDSSCILAGFGDFAERSLGRKAFAAGARGSSVHRARSFKSLSSSGDYNVKLDIDARACISIHVQAGADMNFSLAQDYGYWHGRRLPRRRR